MRSLEYTSSSIYLVHIFGTYIIYSVCCCQSYCFWIIFVCWVCVMAVTDECYTVNLKYFRTMHICRCWLNYIVFMLQFVDEYEFIIYISQSKCCSMFDEQLCCVCDVCVDLGVHPIHIHNNPQWICDEHSVDLLWSRMLWAAAVRLMARLSACGNYVYVRPLLISMMDGNMKITNVEGMFN